jgi:dipeptidyl aminopeptidase/acylaminoacyl peptidase
VRRGTRWLAAGLLLLPLVACSADTSSGPEAASSSAPSESEPAPSTPSEPTPSDPTPADPTPSAAESPKPGQQQAAPLPRAGSPFSLPALMREKFRGSRIRQVRVQAQTDAYTRSEVTYRSGDVTVSGVLLRPRGRGPFPGIVLNHGYIEPSIYVTGQGLAREQDYLARHGFAVLHTDYRGHAASDPATPLERETRLGYTRDTINAVLALEKEPYVDPDRMAMLGRSMGGGVTLNALVARPGLVDAAVVYASVSSRFLDNLRHFTIPGRPEAAQALFDRFGTPQQEPAFYRQLSSRTYFDRITEPVLMHHGTNDESCPFPWARTTARLLKEAGVRSRLDVYPGEMHSFIPRWQDSIERTVRFIREQFQRR